MKKNKERDIYKELSNNALDRFILFLVDSCICLEGKRIDENKGKSLIINYFKICLREKYKYDKSIDYRYLRAIKDIFSWKESTQLLCEITAEVLAQTV